jgi:hypothetical protein
MQSETSNTNTILLILILIILVAFGVWWIAARSGEEESFEPPVRNDAGLNIDIEGSMPNDNDAGSNGSNPNNP